jgi:hypothetical protein
VGVDSGVWECKNGADSSSGSNSKVTAGHNQAGEGEADGQTLLPPVGPQNVPALGQLHQVAGAAAAAAAAIAGAAGLGEEAASPRCQAVLRPEGLEDPSTLHYPAHTPRPPL